MARTRRQTTRTFRAAALVLGVGLAVVAFTSGSNARGDMQADAPVEAAAEEFLTLPSTAAAGSFIELAAADGDDRWVPWLIDLLRVNLSLQTSNAASDALESITGIPSTFRLPDMVEYGGWAQTRAIDGGDGYVEFKAALYERIDPVFGPLLREMTDQVQVAAIQWGGVPLGGIPELNDPDRVAAADADWMFADEVVLGVVSNGQAVAYPLRILARHELANDSVGGDALAIVYCTLCRSALVFERDVAGRQLDFLTSGLLLNSNKVMYDVQTGSTWQHLTGTAIGGELAGTELTVRSVNHLRWSDWVAEHPDTEVLGLPEPIYFENPDRPPIVYDYSPGEAYRSYYENPDLWFPVVDTPGPFDVKTEVVGISRNGESVAFDVAAFNQRAETVDIELGGDVLTVVPTGPGVRVFDSAGDRVPSEQSFWFAWHANHPLTRALEF